MWPHFGGFWAARLWQNARVAITSADFESHIEEGALGFR